MKPPVFVLGSPRSGTTLLYHMLLSAGGFAIYMSETHVFNLVGPRFGDLSREANRRALLDMWLRSFQFKRSGLDPQAFAGRIMADCRDEGEFLRIFMEEIARQQGLDRWAECTPEHLLYLRQVKRAFPDAKIIHIIRDGRDVALSEVRQGWVRPMPWDRSHTLAVSGMHWAWLVSKGREDGQKLGADYMEVRFEELVRNPKAVLPGIADFIGQPLDYEVMQKNAVGTVKRPNTSFASEAAGQPFQPVGRWETELSAEERASMQAAVGPMLKELGYKTDSTGKTDEATSGFTGWRLRAFYLALFGTKFWLKNRTPLGRFTDLGLLLENV